MKDRRPKKRSRAEKDQPSPVSVAFTERGLFEADFDVRSGGGKSFISGQRIVWMEITQRSTGKKVSGKIGTTRKGYEGQRVALLRSLLKQFQNR